MKYNSIKIITGLYLMFLLQIAFAVDVKGIEVDFSIRLKTPENITCAKVTSQPRDGTAQYAQSREQFIFSLNKGEPVIAPAPGIVVRDAANQFLLFHGTDALGNNVMSVFSSTMDDLMVKKGQVVKRGEKIGTVGYRGQGYFSAMVTNRKEAQPFLESIFEFAKATNVPATYFLLPTLAVAGKSANLEFIKYESIKDYGDLDWEKSSKFTGFTYPFACGELK